MRDSGEPTGPMLNGSTYMVRPVEESITWIKGSKPSHTFSAPACVPALVTLHAARKPLIHSSLELSWGHPVAQLPTGPTSWEGHRVPLRRSYNHRLAFYSCHVLGVCAGQPAGREGIVRKMVASRSPSFPEPLFQVQFLSTILLLTLFFSIHSYLNPFLQGLSHLRGGSQGPSPLVAFILGK